MGGTLVRVTNPGSVLAAWRLLKAEPTCVPVLFLLRTTQRMTQVAEYFF